MSVVAGLFVGGRGSRMGGAAKGLLPAPTGEPIVVRTRATLEALGARCVLVGDHPAYADLGLPIVRDDPTSAGPLAGLLALLEHGRSSTVLAVACDMPQLSSSLFARLVKAPRAPVVAPRRHHDGLGWRWEPLIARYDPEDVLPIARAFAARGGTRLQALLDELDASPFALEPGDDAALVDWDTPADLLR